METKISACVDSFYLLMRLFSTCICTVPVYVYFILYKSITHTFQLFKLLTSSFSTLYGYKHLFLDFDIQLGFALCFCLFSGVVLFTEHILLIRINPRFLSVYHQFSLTLLFDFFSRYANLLDQGNQRREKLNESTKAYQLVRAAAELASWITEKENLMVGEEVGEDLEQVEEMQKKFDDFQKVAYYRVLMKGYSPKNKK